jgi:hypothetical protein
MKKFLYFSVALYSLNLSAQQPCQPAADGRYSELTDTVKPLYEGVLLQRAKNNRAADLALLYAPLSYVCVPYSEWGSPKAPYWLSADIHPNFVFRSSFYKLSFHLTPRFIVRGLWDNPKEGDVSMPVRTPSYMPGGTAYYPLNIDIAPDRNVEHNLLSSLSFFHHSNGQDGPTLDSTKQHLYHYNGNFSTFFIEPAITYSRREYFEGTICMDCPGDQRIYRDFFIRLGYEQHFMIADTMKSSFGSTRFNLSCGLISVRSFCDLYIHGIDTAATSEAYSRENWRLLFNITFIAGKRDLELGGIEKRINAELLFNHHLFRAPQTGIFIAVGYYGSDPYNIYYDLSYPYIRAGISVGYFNAPSVNPVNSRLLH